MNLFEKNIPPIANTRIDKAFLEALFKGNSSQQIATLGTSYSQDILTKHTEKMMSYVVRLFISNSISDPAFLNSHRTIFADELKTARGMNLLYLCWASSANGKNKEPR